MNGVTSDLLPISCAVPQGTILGPLLLLMYINDLLNCLKYSTATLYADDTASDMLDIENAMNTDLKLVSLWLKASKLYLNVLKSECMLIGSRQRIAAIKNGLN